MSKGQRGNKEAKKPKKAQGPPPQAPSAAGVPAVAPLPERQRKKP